MKLMKTVSLYSAKAKVYRCKPTKEKYFIQFRAIRFQKERISFNF